MNVLFRSLIVGVPAMRAFTSRTRAAGAVSRVGWLDPSPEQARCVGSVADARVDGASGRGAILRLVSAFGDAIWGVAFLALRGDAANARIAAAASIMIPLGIYACARSVGVPSPRATGAGFAGPFTPAVMNFASAVYVDNLVATLFVSATAFLPRTFTGRRTSCCSSCAEGG